MGLTPEEWDQSAVTSPPSHSSIVTRGRAPPPPRGGRPWGEVGEGTFRAAFLCRWVIWQHERSLNANHTLSVIDARGAEVAARSGGCHPGGHNPRGHTGVA